MNKTIYSGALQLLLLAIVLNVQLSCTAGFKMGSRSLEDVMKESNELDAGNLNKPPKLSDKTAASSSPKSKIILKNKEFLFGEEDDDDEVSTQSKPVTKQTSLPEVAADALEFGEQKLHREQRTNNKKHAFGHNEMDNLSEELKQIAKLENRLGVKQNPVDTYESEYYYDFLANELLKNAAENTDSFMKTREFKGPSVNYLDMSSNNQDLDLDKLILNELLKKSAQNSYENHPDSIQSPAINFKERIISNSLYNNNLKGHIEQSNTNFKTNI